MATKMQLASSSLDTRPHMPTRACTPEISGKAVEREAWQEVALVGQRPFGL